MTSLMTSIDIIKTRGFTLEEGGSTNKMNYTTWNEQKCVNYVTKFVIICYVKNIHTCVVLYVQILDSPFVNIILIIT